ncbi:DNA primase small subunit [Folsomia candida]|uniref:DNA primase n=1 Tax=Folsomia candida TaxID=158441 RepID=A0A226DRU1_FOLCA|nr:DNA primase small subunit [Folsomia candida]OXA46926.1 DNA primase small subunit [Folsomia candida]
MGEYDPTLLPDLLKPYYDRLFPTDLMYRWLSYGSADYFSRREFSFTLMGDVYIRYQSFGSNEEFGKELRRRNPEKIDIGAVYTQKPKSRDSSSGFQPVEKEFVVDIDLTDYDDVRTCCSGAKVCEKCWKFLAIAVKILDAALRDDFGFKHLLWVYSGRRGVHCWISDTIARQLDSHGRGAVIEYLSVIKGGENQAKKVKIPNPETLHPFLQRSVDIIDEMFKEICDDDQNIFNTEANFNILPLDVKMAARNPASRYEDVFNYINDNKKEKKTLRQLHPELLLQFCYPRLDVNVSKGINHLLKSPFCIHPKTGQVCVPFDPKYVDKFKTTDVPSITQLMDEIGEHDKAKESEVNVLTWKKTKMAPYMKIFNDFIKKLEKDRETRDKSDNNKELF